MGQELQSTVVPINVEDEMKKSYMDYAMSVIVGRALPDARDGLKPVHRRILYAMYDLGNSHDKPYKKSARVVGDVIGKYHPHGDTAVYDAIVRMAQDFSMRYELVDGQGNFGSIDGDNPAAMRYTEIRMEKLTAELLKDIERETVDFTPNYDESLEEPSVMPAAFPNLLANGSSGIAVGMATNIPPHNLGELINATIAQIDNPDIEIEGLMQFIPGPDFPTGGFIYGKDEIINAYKTGRGILHVRGKAFVEKAKKGDKESIIITELPYQVNKSKLVERIAELVRDKKIEGIADLRDESDREGIRIVIDLKKDEQTTIVLNNLYKLTPLQSSFGIILLAIADNQPKVLNLKEALGHFIDFRKEVVTKRTLFDLKKAEAKAHILEGLKKALDNLDEVIRLIRGSKTPSEAKEKLIFKFQFTDIQAQAILDMKLQRLTGLEREKLLEELAEVLKEILWLKKVLSDETVLLGVIKDELMQIKNRFADERRTEIVEETKELAIEDLIADEDMVVTVSYGGYIKRNPIDLYRAQIRGGKGKTGMSTKEDDFLQNIFIASTHNYILLFTDKGKVYWLKVHEIPQAGRIAKGKALVNLINVDSDENITAILPVREFEAGKYIVMATSKGYVKKTDLLAYSNPRSTGIIALHLDEGDRLAAVSLCDEESEILLSTKDGKAIRFKQSRVRDMGRTARGVIGIELDKTDELISMEILKEDATILSVTKNGYGKRTELKEYPLQNRAGKGVITIKTTERNGDVVGVLQVKESDDIMLITNNGRIIRTSAAGISVIGRNTQGVKLIWLEKEENVAGVAFLAEKDEEE